MNNDTPVTDDLCPLLVAKKLALAIINLSEKPNGTLEDANETIRIMGMLARELYSEAGKVDATVTPIQHVA
ncbi:hypothetical protein [[Erwinia] mediterraneensis]|uniref:hypothetical protein n=1 Tax=[Erwinia] mediterraneensis TaxID=2161819 RepID=UPI001030B6D2|nr:hypothetical protein [[Erwinia] mediterraneensis]